MKTRIDKKLIGYKNNFGNVDKKEARIDKNENSRSILEAKN